MKPEQKRAREPLYECGCGGDAGETLERTGTQLGVTSGVTRGQEVALACQRRDGLGTPRVGAGAAAGTRLQPRQER